MVGVGVAEGLAQPDHLAFELQRRVPGHLFRVNDVLGSGHVTVGGMGGLRAGLGRSPDGKPSSGEFCTVCPKSGREPRPFSVGATRCPMRKCPPATRASPLSSGTFWTGGAKESRARTRTRRVAHGLRRLGRAIPPFDGRKPSLSLDPLLSYVISIPGSIVNHDRVAPAGRPESYKYPTGWPQNPHQTLLPLPPQSHHTLLITMSSDPRFVIVVSHFPDLRRRRGLPWTRR